MRVSLVPLVSLVSVVMLLVLPAATAHAKRQPADVFGGRIMTSEKSYPSSSRSTDAYISQVKKQSKDRFQEDKEKQEWRIYYAAFFKKPLNDMEIKVTVYDATDKRFIASWEEYLTERGQRAIVGRMNLKREEGKLDANTKVLVVMESGGKIIASATIYVLGQAKKRSGRADFSEEDTKEKDEE
jgi:hypothetical protein